MTANVPLVTEITLAARNIGSLVWDGDTLVDWVGSGDRYSLDGGFTPGTIPYRFSFDAAVASIDGRYVVIYQKLGTKGLMLDRGEILREIHRTCEDADVYEYPVALSSLPDGRAILIHCPDSYDRLEIEDVVSGRQLTRSRTRNPQDFFHSRLSVSADGRFLKSAGWVWHPVDDVRCFDLDLAMSDPGHLDSDGLLGPFYAEDSCAAFDPDGRLWVAIDGDIKDKNQLNEVRVMAPGSPAPPRVFSMSVKIGTILPVGDRHILSLYEYPKLIALSSGKVVQSWSHIASGKQASSILVGAGPVPPIALSLDPPRMAVAADDRISVLQFEI